MANCDVLFQTPFGRTLSILIDILVASQNGKRYSGKKSIAHVLIDGLFDWKSEKYRLESQENASHLQKYHFKTVCLLCSWYFLTNFYEKILSYPLIALFYPNWLSVTYVNKVKTTLVRLPNHSVIMCYCHAMNAAILTRILFLSICFSYII